MYRFFLLITTFFLCFGFAIEIELKPDAKAQVTSNDIAAMKRYLKKKYRFIVNDNGAKQLVKENRALANAYMKSDDFKKFDKDLFKIEVEKRLADEYVRKIQRKIKIPEKVLRSYYNEHRDKFKKEPEVYLVRYTFKTYNDALQFYEQHSQDRKKLLHKYKGIQKDIGYASIEKIKEPLQSLLKKYARPGYLTPPFVWAPNRYDLYYVKDIRSNRGFKSFQEVKKEIADLLHQKRFVKDREQILKKYFKDDSE